MESKTENSESDPFRILIPSIHHETTGDAGFGHDGSQNAGPGD